MKDNMSVLLCMAVMTITDPVTEHRDQIPLFMLIVIDLTSGMIIILLDMIITIIVIDHRIGIFPKMQGIIHTTIDSLTGNSVRPDMITTPIGGKTMIGIMPQPTKTMTGDIKTIMTSDWIRTIIIGMTITNLD